MVLVTSPRIQPSAPLYQHLKTPFLVSLYTHNKSNYLPLKTKQNKKFFKSHILSNSPAMLLSQEPCYFSLGVWRDTIRMAPQDELTSLPHTSHMAPPGENHPVRLWSWHTAVRPSALSAVRLELSWLLTLSSKFRPRRLYLERIACYSQVLRHLLPPFTGISEALTLNTFHSCGWHGSQSSPSKPSWVAKENQRDCISFVSVTEIWG